MTVDRLKVIVDNIQKRYPTALVYTSVDKTTSGDRIQNLVFMDKHEVVGRVNIDTGEFISAP